MPLQFRKRTVAIAVAATYGTIGALTSAEAGYRFDDPELKYLGDIVEREKSDGNLGTDQGALGPSSTTLVMKNRLQGDGSSGDPSYAAVLFPCVGMPSNSSNSYQTASSNANWKGLDAALNRDGKRRLMRSGMGDLTIDLESGKPGMLNWSFVGGYSANSTDTAQLTGISFEDVVAPIWANASALTIGGTAYKASKAQLKLNTQPFLRHDPTKAGGYIGGWITNIKPTITIDPETVAIATFDWDAARTAGTQQTIIFTLGSASGNTITITCTLCQLTKPSDDTDRNGLLIDALQFSVNGTVTILFA